MQSLNILATVSVVALATAAYAHTNVSNAAVKVRMDSMSTIAGNMKVMGDMVKGVRSFDAAQAKAAAAAIATEAARTPGLFEAREDDPKSEARPAIWENFADFTAKAKAMEAAAQDAATGISSPETLRATMGQIGETCKACHKSYRE